MTKIGFTRLRRAIDFLRNIDIDSTEVEYDTQILSRVKGYEYENNWVRRKYGSPLEIIVNHHQELTVNFPIAFLTGKKSVYSHGKKKTMFIDIDIQQKPKIADVGNIPDYKRALAIGYMAKTYGIEMNEDTELYQMYKKAMSSKECRKCVKNSCPKTCNTYQSLEKTS